MGTVRTWRRPYRDSLRIATGFLALFASGFACVVFVGILVGHAAFRGADVVLAAIMLFFLTVVWRLHRTALVAGDPGVRVRSMRTRAPSWARCSGGWPRR